MTPRAVSWSITISTKRICGGVRLRSFKNSENADCAATRSSPTRLRTKWASEGASLRANNPERSVAPSPSPISTRVDSNPFRSAVVSGWLVRSRWMTVWSRWLLR